MIRTRNRSLFELLLSTTLLLLMGTWISSGVLLAQTDESRSNQGPPDNAEVDTDIDVQVPGLLRISLDDAGSDLSYSEYVNNNDSGVFLANTTNWSGFSNWAGGDTTIEYKIDPFYNNPDNGEFYRDARISVFHDGGDDFGWGGSSETNGAGNSATVSATSSVPGGGTPLKSDMLVEIEFIHNSSDQNDDGEYFAPSGVYTTTLTGTISASD